MFGAHEISVCATRCREGAVVLIEGVDGPSGSSTRDHVTAS
jgi:hypothetical protein